MLVLTSPAVSLDTFSCSSLNHCITLKFNSTAAEMPVKFQRNQTIYSEHILWLKAINRTSVPNDCHDWVAKPPFQYKDHLSSKGIPIINLYLLWEALYKPYIYWTNVIFILKKPLVSWVVSIVGYWWCFFFLVIFVPWGFFFIFFLADLCVSRIVHVCNDSDGELWIAMFFVIIMNTEEKKQYFLNCCQLEPLWPSDANWLLHQGIFQVFLQVMKQTASHYLSLWWPRSNNHIGIILGSKFVTYNWC